MHLTSFKDFDAIIEVNEKMGLPKVINLYGTEVTFRHTNNFLKNLGSSGIQFVNINPIHIIQYMLM